MDRGDYWRLRALTEQRDKERAEGALAALRAQMEIQKTSAAIDAVMQRLKADGVVDLTEGAWLPNDAEERFERAPETPPSQEAPVTS